MTIEDFTRNYPWAVTDTAGNVVNRFTAADDAKSWANDSSYGERLTVHFSPVPIDNAREMTFL